MTLNIPTPEEMEKFSPSPLKNTASSVLKMRHEKDPKIELTDKVGDISGVRVAPPQILCAIYIRPKQTRSGLYITDKFQQEDEWQGKVCLVLKKGNSAFVDDDRNKFHGFKAEVGEWITLKHLHGMACHLNGVPCRWIEDTTVMGVLPDPDMIY